MDQKNLLTITATEYAKIVGKSLSNFRAVGFHTSGTGLRRESDQISYNIAHETPHGTVAIVNYTYKEFPIQRPNNDIAYVATGTALIPKKPYDKAHSKK